MGHKKLEIASAFAGMVAIVAASNYLVEFPINNWLTWGALTYPITFLITEIANRTHGPTIARRIVYAGFFTAVMLSIKLATPRIACASGMAFLLAQLLDISVFNRLRTSAWWYAPFCASVMASLIDTCLFWSVAFWGEQFPWVTLAIGDFAVKLGLDIALLLPFRLATRVVPQKA